MSKYFRLPVAEAADYIVKHSSVSLIESGEARLTHRADNFTLISCGKPATKSLTLKKHIPGINDGYLGEWETRESYPMASRWAMVEVNIPSLGDMHSFMRAVMSEPTRLFAMVYGLQGKPHALNEFFPKRRAYIENGGALVDNPLTRWVVLDLEGFEIHEESMWSDVDKLVRDLHDYVLPPPFDQASYVWAVSSSAMLKGRECRLRCMYRMDAAVPLRTLYEAIKVHPIADYADVSVLRSTQPIYLARPTLWADGERVRDPLAGQWCGLVERGGDLSAEFTEVEVSEVDVLEAQRILDEAKAARDQLQAAEEKARNDPRNRLIRAFEADSWSAVRGGKKSPAYALAVTRRHLDTHVRPKMTSGAYPIARGLAWRLVHTVPFEVAKQLIPRIRDEWGSIADEREVGADLRKRGSHYFSDDSLLQLMTGAEAKRIRAN